MADIPTTMDINAAVSFSTYEAACEYATSIGVPVSYAALIIDGRTYLCRPGSCPTSNVYIAKPEDAS